MNQSLVSFESVAYSYANGRDFNFTDLSFSIPENTITSFLGRNGVGKTTLLLMILGFLKPNRGQVRYSFSQNGEYYGSYAQKISYLPQIETAPLDLTVFDYLLMARVPYISPFMLPDNDDFQIVWKYINLLGIQNFSDYKLGTISGGELQRVRLGRALVQESDLILLDEPITHLDINAKYVMMDLISQLKKMGKTIIFSTHDPVEALQISDYSLLIQENNAITFGPSLEILTEDHLTSCFDIPIKIIREGNRFSCLVDQEQR